MNTAVVENSVCRVENNYELDFPEKHIQKEKKEKWEYKPHPVIEWCRWNGTYIYSYGCAFTGILCGILSPIIDMPQGGNYFPYVSEVIRSGKLRTMFVFGCVIGFIPTLIFATNYFKTMIRYSKTFGNRIYRYYYHVIELIQMLLLYYSAFSVMGVAYCDMDFHPDAHTLFSSTWVFLTNVMEVFQFQQISISLYRGKNKDTKYVAFKLALLIFSICGMLNFVILGSYVPCHCTLTLSLITPYSKEFNNRTVSTNLFRRVVLQIADAYAFSGLLRMYSHCQTLHFIRGLGEFISMVCTMFYLNTMVYDIKKVNSLINGEVDNTIGIRDEESVTCHCSCFCLLLIHE